MVTTTPDYGRIVFPFKAPPVATAFWTPEDWARYIRSFRPADYTGDETDREAWLDYLDRKNLERFRKTWPQVELVGRDQFRLVPQT